MTTVYKNGDVKIEYCVGCNCYGQPIYAVHILRATPFYSNIQYSSVIDSDPVYSKVYKYYNKNTLRD